MSVGTVEHVGGNAAGGTVVAPTSVTGKPKKKRNKATKPKFALPLNAEGKSVAYPSGTTPESIVGFNVDANPMLKELDFADPLDYAQWRVWYFSERMKSAQREVENINSLGKTFEERKSARDEAKLLKFVESALGKIGGASPGAKKDAMQSRIEEMFAKFLTTGGK